MDILGEHEKQHPVVSAPVRETSLSRQPEYGFFIRLVIKLSGGRWLRDSTYNLGAFLATDSIDPINQNNWTRGAYYYYAQNYGASDGAWYMMVYALENYPNPIIENSAAGGVVAPNGTVFKYGSGSDGVITVGRSK